MRPRDTISSAIQAAVAEGGPALVGYLTAGFPSRRQFKDNLAAVASACDVVEIGVPFSDPMADGTTIQRASFVALADGVTLPWILQELKAVTELRTAHDAALHGVTHPLDELSESAAQVWTRTDCRARPRRRAWPGSSFRTCPTRKAMS